MYSPKPLRIDCESIEDFGHSLSRVRLGNRKRLPLFDQRARERIGENARRQAHAQRFAACDLACAVFGLKGDPDIETGKRMRRQVAVNGFRYGLRRRLR